VTVAKRGRGRPPGTVSAAQADRLRAAQRQVVAAERALGEARGELVSAVVAASVEGGSLSAIGEALGLSISSVRRMLARIVAE